MRKAVQYVRMSTDGQEFSPANQVSAMAAWADAHGVEIIGTYEDAGRSGLTLKGRPALRQLIADVLSEAREFDTILVYDVSRWGRFQDADESAHLEFLCRSAGVNVHYCAEPFSNDGSPYASLFKVMKRTLAAEYSRELSVKVRAGKARLAAQGFRQGGNPGFALDRLLVDKHGHPKRRLSDGEYKGFITDRIRLTLGPPDDVETVRWIYEAYADQRLSISNICDTLNDSGKHYRGRPWGAKAVHTILSSQKYAGYSVWGMSRVHLGTDVRTSIPREDWIIRKEAHEPVVSVQLFERAQARRRALARKIPSDQELLDRLRKLDLSGQPLTYRSMAANKIHRRVYNRRFGSIVRAFELCSVQPGTKRRDWSWWNVRALRCKAILHELKDAVEASGSTLLWDSVTSSALINDELRVTACPSRRATFRRSGRTGWQLSNRLPPHDLVVMERLSDKFEHIDYYILPPREDRRGANFREVNEDYLEALRVTDLTRLADACQRLPLDQSLLKRTHNGPELVATGRAKLPRYSKSGGRWIRAVANYLSRKRRLIDKAADVRHLTTRLEKETLGFLHRPKVVEQLTFCGLTSAPSFLFRDYVELSEPIHSSSKHERKTPFTDQNCLCGETVSCLQRMTPQRQLAVAQEFACEQRSSSELARVLLIITPTDQLLVPHDRARKLYARWSRRAATILHTYDAALLNYPKHAVRLCALHAFARRLVEDGKLELARSLAGPRRVRALRTAIEATEAWRTSKEKLPFSRGRISGSRSHA